jgi:DNA mismatch repair ATPase MutL
MKSQTDFSIVELRHYIRAARDAGYRGISAAIAELIDNSFEANASRVDIRFTEANEGGGGQFIVAVSDDGVGMSPSTLRSALRFGGTTRFNS